MCLKTNSSMWSKNWPQPNDMLELPIVAHPPTSAETTRPKRPEWLKVRLPMGENYRNVRSIVDEFKAAHHLSER
jgi:lipoate synthase